MLALVGSIAPTHANAQVDPVVIATRWIDAARTGDAKQLSALSALPMTVQDVTNNDGSVSRCVPLKVTSRAAVEHGLRVWKAMFVGTPTWQRTDAGTDWFECPARGARRRTVIASKPGDIAVTFELGGTQVTVRVSKGGKVVAVTRLAYDGGE